MKEVEPADITRLLWLCYVHNGERRDVPHSDPMRSFFVLQKYGLVALVANDEGCTGEPATWAHLLAGASIDAQITEKGRAFCDAVTAAAKAQLGP